jgi:hypothetical protein
MKLLSKNDIIQAEDVVFEYVDVPEWGGKVKLYAMSLSEHIGFEKLKATDGSINGEQIVFVLSNGIRDEDGNKLFTKEDAKALLKKNTSVVSRLFMRCAELSKVSTPDSEKMEKN